MKHRNRPRRLGALALAAVVLAALVPSAAMAEGPELISNGTFDNGHAPWWGTGNLALDSSSGLLCADVPGGTVNPWDVIIGYDGVPLQAGESYDFGFRASGAPSTVGRALVQLPVAPYTQYLSAAPELVPGGSGFAYTFTSPVDLPNAQVAFQLGGKAEPWRFCLDNVTLTGGAEPPVYVPDTGPRVRVNQVGYLPDGPKNATLVTEATSPLPFAVLDAQGRTLTRGTTVPRGLDASSGQNVHSIDFGSPCAGRPPDSPSSPTARPAAPSTSTRTSTGGWPSTPCASTTRSAAASRSSTRCAPATPGPPATSARPPTPATPASPASPASAATASTSPAAGTTPATTGSTSSTAVSPSTSS